MSIGAKSGLFGASILGFASNGNVMLALNKSYALGPKGTVLEIPLDRVIFKSVRQSGMWEIEESIFFCRRTCPSSSKSRFKNCFS